MYSTMSGGRLVRPASHSDVFKKAQQRQQLFAILSRWVQVRLYCFIIGHTGSLLMLATNANILAKVGISFRTASACRQSKLRYTCGPRLASLQPPSSLHAALSRRHCQCSLVHADGDEDGPVLADDEDEPTSHASMRSLPPSPSPQICPLIEGEVRVICCACRLHLCTHARGQVGQVPALILLSPY